jgi:23S rRNA (pseudouridine1915-N3)-methyltransferase
MRLTLAHVGDRHGKRDAFDAIAADYVERCSAFAQCETRAFHTDAGLLVWLDRQKTRTPVVAAFFDSRGRQMSSEVFAKWIGERRDHGTQHIVAAIGPASGWSSAARDRAQLLLSLGPFTLPHALARLVVAEQLYRAFTILSGHPYHCGH